MLRSAFQMQKYGKSMQIKNIGAIFTYEKV